MLTYLLVLVNRVRTGGVGTESMRRPLVYIWCVCGLWVVGCEDLKAGGAWPETEQNMSLKTKLGQRLARSEAIEKNPEFTQLEKVNVCTIRPVVHWGQREISRADDVVYGDSDK